MKAYYFLHYLTGSISEKVEAKSLTEAEQQGYEKGWRLFMIIKG
jgi:hypothetical protein